MAFVYDDQVILIDVRYVSLIRRVQDTANKALDGANMNAGFVIGYGVLKTLQPKYIGKCLAVDDLGGGKFIFGLLTKSAAVDDKTHTPEAFGCDQAVQHCDG